MSKIPAPRPSPDVLPGPPGGTARHVDRDAGSGRLTNPPLPPQAIIAPHAGYIYSGPIAASVYAPIAVLRGKHRRVDWARRHRVFVEGLAVPVRDVSTPLGKVALDRMGIARIADLPQVVVSDEGPRAGEHSLEVQLPFLQTVLGEFLLLPLVGEGIGRTLLRFWNASGRRQDIDRRQPDLSHYLNYDAASPHRFARGSQTADLEPLE